MDQLQDEDDLQEQYGNRFNDHINLDETQGMRNEMQMMMKEFPGERFANEQETFEETDDADSEELSQANEELRGREEQIKKRRMRNMHTSKNMRRRGPQGPSGNDKTIENQESPRQKNISQNKLKRASNAAHYLNRITDGTDNHASQSKSRGVRRAPSNQSRRPKKKTISSRGNSKSNTRNQKSARNSQSRRPYRTRDMSKGNAMQKEDNFVESFMDQMFSSKPNNHL